MGRLRFKSKKDFKSFTYNQDGFKLLFDSNEIWLSKQFYLKRTSKGNEWKEASWEDVKDSKYNTPFPFANGLVTGIITLESNV